LVEGGAVGACLFLAAVVLWSWQLHHNLAVNDRPFLVAFMVAIGVYALTDNPLSSTYLSGFIYLGVLRNEGWGMGAEEEGSEARLCGGIGPPR
jgi:hypothetical protein